MALEGYTPDATSRSVVFEDLRNGRGSHKHRLSSSRASTDSLPPGPLPVALVGPRPCILLLTVGLSQSAWLTAHDFRTGRETVVTCCQSKDRSSEKHRSRLSCMAETPNAVEWFLRLPVSYEATQDRFTHWQTESVWGSGFQVTLSALLSRWTAPSYVSSVPFAASKAP